MVLYRPCTTLDITGLVKQVWYPTRPSMFWSPQDLYWQPFLVG